MQTIRTAILTLALLAIAALSAHAQPCTGPVPDGSGPSRVIADGRMPYSFEYEDALFDASAGVELQLHRRIGGVIAPASTSQQVFTRAAVVKHAPGCYGVALSAVPSIERGFEVAARVRAVFDDGRAPSGFSNFADPFVWPLPAPVLRRGDVSQP